MINEIKRMQQLAGLNEKLRPQGNNIETELQGALQRLTRVYGEDYPFSDEFNNLTVKQIQDDFGRARQGGIKVTNMNAGKDIKMYEELGSITPADVSNLSKAQNSATSVQNKAKYINNINELPGAFENWFKTLGIQPGKLSKSAMINVLNKSLINLGFK